MVSKAHVLEVPYLVVVGRELGNMGRFPKLGLPSWGSH